ncbi:MAG: type II toxin-antitoxin system Phd/YefM family antitoxin [Verrucomicrobia bacterium]|nr:type II toxin-antitoxin system Phd/YefM family antitoxin [Verrucomicrobiota bacterium]
MTTQQISVSEFKAHCAEQLRKVETEDVALQITRHGKVVATVQKPVEEVSENKKCKSLVELMGSLKGTVTFADDYDPDEPTWTDGEWEDHPVNMENS